jgi:hypothetical protein
LRASQKKPNSGQELGNRASLGQESIRSLGTFWAVCQPTQHRDRHLWFQSLHLAGDLRTGLTGQEVIGDDEVHVLFAKQFQRGRAIGSGQDAITGVFQNELSHSKRGLFIVDAKDDTLLE